jgi:uncharacterized protein YjbJ (UPF0337 family)
MDWDKIEGNWKQLSERTKKQWGILTDDDLQVVAGHRHELAGKIQERHGVGKYDADKQIKAWQNRAHESWIR